MKTFTLPYYNTKGESNKTTIKKALEIILDHYIVNFEVMEQRELNETLETIANLTYIYFNMEE